MKAAVPAVRAEGAHAVEHGDGSVSTPSALQEVACGQNTEGNASKQTHDQTTISRRQLQEIQTRTTAQASLLLLLIDFTPRGDNEL